MKNKPCHLNKNAQHPNTITRSKELVPAIRTKVSGVVRIIFLAILCATIIRTPCHGVPPPAEGDWARGMTTEPPKPGEDRVFLMNRGWVSGQVTGIDATSVTIQVDGKTQKYARTETSLVQLTDWMNPEKRKDTQEIKLRIEMEGACEAGQLYFSEGTIVKKWDSPPVFSAGGDSDDRVMADSTGISFDKGGGDRSITKIVASVTLLLPVQDNLVCELESRRANGDAGPFTVHFLDAATGKERITLKRPVTQMWVRMEIPIKKLVGNEPASRIDYVAFMELKPKRVEILPLPKAPSNPKDTTEARVILMNSQMGSGKIIGLDGDNLTLQVGIVSKPIQIPRWKIATIELNEWESTWRNASTRVKPDAELTPPITVVFAGSSSESQLDLQGEDSVAQMLVAPHFVSAWDRDDLSGARSERTIFLSKQGLDHSHSQMEATVVLRLKNPRGMEAKLHNHYTNGIAGDLKFMMLNALTKKEIAASGPETEKNLISDMKISRSRFFGQ